MPLGINNSNFENRRLELFKERRYTRNAMFDKLEKTKRHLRANRRRVDALKTWTRDATPSSVDRGRRKGAYQKEESSCLFDGAVKGLFMFISDLKRSHKTGDRVHKLSAGHKSCGETEYVGKSPRFAFHARSRSFPGVSRSPSPEHPILSAFWPFSSRLCSTLGTKSESRRRSHGKSRGRNILRKRCESWRARTWRLVAEFVIPV